MNYKEFLKALKDGGVDIDPYLPFNVDSLFLYQRKRRGRVDGNDTRAPDSEYLAQHWTAGGASGGNCWNDAEPESEPVSPDAPPSSFTDFDSALELICPSLTFLQYKRLEAKVVQSDSVTHYEYYGNYEIYAYRIVMLKKLFEELVAMGLIS
jgi:hypothetical protein